MTFTSLIPADDSTTLYVAQGGYDGNGICFKEDEGVAVMDSSDNGMETGSS